MRREPILRLLLALSNIELTPSAPNMMDAHKQRVIHDTKRGEKLGIDGYLLADACSVWLSDVDDVLIFSEIEIFERNAEIPEEGSGGRVRSRVTYGSPLKTVRLPATEPLRS